MIERRPRRLMNQINVVPYIDVMLVLLIIFMVTAPLINPGEINLPKVGESLQAPVAPLEVDIRADRSLWLRDRQTGGTARPMTRQELVQAIQDKQARNPDQPVVIAADKSIPYGDVLKVMDILQRNQVKRIGLLAQPRTS
ncbi:MAG: protein TolR [Betaproteobacteria bacterium]|nr:protein TolR [Betaproteobacteria bacterium]